MKWIKIFNPIHVIMGLVLIGVGGDLLFHDHYFMWPPGADTYINSDLIGGWGFLTGVGLVFAGMRKYMPISFCFYILGL